ncbi:MAG TPA: tripartite tricarboxylate transporter TctB family protein [Pseudolabrys sp.]
MSDETDHSRSLVSIHTMEMATALVILVFATVVMVSNYELGAGWDSSGPQSGYFPFYVGAILFISSAGILIGELMKRKRGTVNAASFVDTGPFISVLRIFIPIVIYIIAVIYIGIYVSSAVFIATFMVWLGKYRVVVAALYGIGIAVVLFLTFEVWFLVPLPKGPLEALFGY